MFLRFPLLLVPLTTALFSNIAQGVVVSMTTGNLTAPGDDPGWANVGSCNGAGAVYLGDRWVLTAYHVNASASFPVAFGNTNYTTIPATGTRLTNNGVGGMTAQTDLIMIRLVNDPGLPALTISASAPLLGNDLVMIGNGRDRQASRTFWQVTMNSGTPPDDTWVETTGAHNVEGYKWSGTQSKRWGTNDAEAVNVNINYGVGTVRSMLSLFDEDGGLTNEAVGMIGDSGGGVFYKNGAQWELSGVMLASGTLGNPTFFDNAPANTALYEQSVTITADLSFYRTQILGIMIPEPSGFMLVLTGALMALRRRRPGSVR